MKFSMFTAATPEWSPQEVVANLARQGWDGVEWRVVDQTESEIPQFWVGNRATWPFSRLAQDAPEIVELTRAARLEISALGAYVSCTDHDDVERVLEIAARMGVPGVRIRIPPCGDASYPQHFSMVRQHMAWVAERARRHGVRALIELHFGSIVASASAAIRLLGDLDPDHVGVIHDLGNLVVEGWEEPLAGLQLLGPHLAHVHVKNAEWVPGGLDENGHRVWSWRFASMRDGQADVFAYFRALRAVGYDGWVVCEDFSTGVALEERTADNLSYLRAAAAAAGY